LTSVLEVLRFVARPAGQLPERGSTHEGDRDAILGALNAGVKIITSAHGYNISELKSRREVLKLLEDKVFDRYIVLGNSKGPGTLVEVIDGTTMKTVAGEGCHDI